MTNPYYEYAEAPFAAAPSALLDFSVAETPDGNALYFFLYFAKVLPCANSRGLKRQRKRGMQTVLREAYYRVSPNKSNFGSPDFTPGPHVPYRARPARNQPNKVSTHKSDRDCKHATNEFAFRLST